MGKRISTLRTTIIDSMISADNDATASNWFDYFDFIVKAFLQESLDENNIMVQSTIWWQPISETTIISFANLTRVRKEKKMYSQPLKA